MHVCLLPCIAADERTRGACQHVAACLSCCEQSVAFCGSLLPDPLLLALPCPQILLPPSAGASLMGQDAYKNGPMFFQLTNAAGNRTHAGLLEFSAAEGFVGLKACTLYATAGGGEWHDQCF